MAERKWLYSPTAARTENPLRSDSETQTAMFRSSFLKHADAIQERSPKEGKYSLRILLTE